jgi:hypothetical protein
MDRPNGVVHHHFAHAVPEMVHHLPKQIIAVRRFTDTRRKAADFRTHAGAKIATDPLFDFGNVVTVIGVAGSHKNEPCVTFNVNGLKPLAVLLLSRIAASGCVYEYATEVFDVAAVKFGSLTQVTSELGVCMISSSEYCRVAVVPVEAPSTRTATGVPFIQSNASGRDWPTLDNVIVIVLAKPTTLPLSFASFQNLKAKHRLCLFAI